MISLCNYQIDVLMRQLKLVTKSVVQIFLSSSLEKHFRRALNPFYIFLCKTWHLLSTTWSHRCPGDVDSPQSLCHFGGILSLLRLVELELPGRSSHVVPPMCESSDSRGDGVLLEQDAGTLLKMLWDGLHGIFGSPKGFHQLDGWAYCSRRNRLASTSGEVKAAVLANP